MDGVGVRVGGDVNKLNGGVNQLYINSKQEIVRRIRNLKSRCQKRFV
jgi:hypothetical protein